MRHSRLRTLLTVDEGNAAVEFAFVVPMFLMLVFGVIEFGRVLWTEQALQETAIAGARCMALAQGSKPNGSCTSSGSYSSSATTSYVHNVASGWGVTVPNSNNCGSPGTSGICPSTPATCGGTSGFSQVTLSYTFNSPVATLIKMSSSGIALSTSACYPNNT
jgi:Flp pilus assembly protein TadG